MAAVFEKNEGGQRTKVGKRLKGCWKDLHENGNDLDEAVSGDGEKYLGSGYILKTEPTEVGNRLNIGFERKGGVRED